MDEFGRLGVKALSEATPRLTGETASSWYYEVKYDTGKATLTFNNSNVNEGQVIAILIQEGHGTGTGGFVPGYSYLDEALNPLMKELIDKVWKEVTSK